MRSLLLLLAAVSLTVQAATPTLPADIDPQSYSRLPLLPRSSLDTEGKRIFDAINTAVTGKQEELPRMGEKDRVVIGFGRQLLKQHKLDSATYAKVVELFGKQGMIELSMSLGDYVMTAILLNTVDQRLPPGREANLPPK